MREVILHLSHTDIKTDARILKIMNSLASRDQFQIYGIGVKLEEGTTSAYDQTRIQLESLKVWGTKLYFFSALVKHSLLVLELIIFMSARAIKLRPKVIHAHDVVVLPIAVFLKIITGCKLIYDAHELESNKNGTTPLLGKLTLLVEKLLWKKIDAFITVSDAIKDWYNHSISKKKSWVILNSPQLSSKENVNHKYDSNYLHNKYKIPSNQLIFLYIGILGKGRGIEHFLNIFAKRRNQHVVFLGYGEMKELIILEEIKHPNIHYHPPVRHDEVVLIAKTANVGLCLIENISLSDYLCLPNKLFEYAFSQIPIIGSDFPEISSVVNKYGLGVVCQPDEESIEKAINHFSASEPFAFPKLETLYPLSWEAQEQKIKELYDQIIQ